MELSIDKKVKDLKKSSTLAINEESLRLENLGYKIFRLGLGQSPFPVPDIVVNELKNNASKKEYLPVQGLFDLRENIAKFTKKENGLNVEAKDVMVGPGLKELIFIIQNVFNGEILLTNPSWVSYSPQAKINGRKVQWINTNFKDKWKISPENLSNIGKKDSSQLLILNYPNNPTGITYNKKELKALAEVAREKEIIILSDEIYGRLNFVNKHHSIAEYYPEGTIVSSGLSKWCGAGGWRLGTMVIPEELNKLKKAMITVASETYTTVNSPTQYAAVKAFEKNKEIDNYLKHSKRILNWLNWWCTEKLLYAGLKVHPAEGGFYLFPDFSNYIKTLSKFNIKTSNQLCAKLLKEAGVATLPGSCFGRSEKELTMRLAFVNFDGVKALKASYKLGLNKKINLDFLKKYCGSTLDAFERIVDWLNKKELQFNSSHKLIKQSN